MARPKSGAGPRSNAERQAAYRARRKAAGLRRKDGWIDPTVNPHGKLSKEQEEISKRWKKEMQEEELKAARKAGRQREREKHYRKGYIKAMISVGDFFIRQDRPDIARSVLDNFNITRKDCADCGNGSFELQLLDKYNAFDKPDKPIN
jgi:hypothetical protein